MSLWDSAFLMEPTPVLPKDVWGAILLHSDSRSLITLKKVSKVLRLLVRDALEIRWDKWRSRAARVANMSQVRGDGLDRRLFNQICAGNNQLVFPKLKKDERDWLHVR